MMQRLYASILLACVSVFAHAEDTVVVAELVDVRKGPCEIDSSLDRECTQKFIATYRVVARLAGTTPIPNGTFEGKIAERDLAATTNDKYTLQGFGDDDKDDLEIAPKPYPVHRTSDGHFAQCGCPSAVDAQEDSEKKKLRKLCTDVTFSPAITEDLTNASTYRRQLLAARGYQVRGNQATCVRGVKADAFVQGPQN